jgi:HPt (histidine-containing phosphotransfer) domain-containing protein
MTWDAPTGPQDLDEGRLREMLDLVGPASELRLLQSLMRDLTAARGALARAIADGDARAVSAQTHVLAALAGTFGAPLLAAAAQSLDGRSRAAAGRAAAGPAAQGTVPDGAEVLAMTDRLLRRLTQRLAERAVPARGLG